MSGFVKDMENADKKVVWAARHATKGEAYRLMRLLQKEIKAGAPGGVPFAPIREITKETRAGNIPKPKPLYRLFNAVRYRATTEGSGLTIGIGGIEGMVSSSWLRILLESQTGSAKPVDPKFREHLLSIGIGLKGTGTKKATGLARYFFLKRQTQTFKTPARSIMDAFWNEQAGQVMTNIQTEFNRLIEREKI